MRFLGKWLVWIGGLALLYVDLRPLVEQTLEAYRAGRSLGLPLEEWLLRFARPVFVLGVLCAAALPDLGGRRERKKAVAPLPPAPAPAPAPPPPVLDPGNSSGGRGSPML